MAADETPVPEADVPSAVLQRETGGVVTDGDVAMAAFNRQAAASVVKSAPAPVAEAAAEPQLIEPEPAPAIVEHPADPEIAQVEAEFSHAWAAERTKRADDFVARAKQAVADGLAAQPFHGTTVMFDDLICVANAIIESLAAEMRG